MRKWTPILCCFLFLFAIACGNKEVSNPVDEKPVEEEEVEDVVQEPLQEETEEEKEEEVFPFTAPLTGLGSIERVDERIIMVMVDNAPNARPQSGLDKADIVYEMLEEGWITRFNAIFQGQKPEVIGPVRSIRPYNIELALGYDAVMVHAGGSPEALEMLRSNGYADMDEIYNAGAYFWRETFRNAPHNLYTNLDQLREGAEAKGFREHSNVPNLKFKPVDQEMEGEPASDIQVQYHSQYQISYQYDEEAEKYLRFSEGTPHKDLTTGEQYAATNVLVVAAHHQIIDDVGRRRIDLTGPGNGYLFQRGKAVPVKWRKEDGIIRAYKDGVEVGYYPGNTWVNVIPNVPSLDQLVTFK